MEIEIPLSDFEIETLNKSIHTHAFADYPDMEAELRTLITREKDRVIADGKTDDGDFRHFQSQTVTNIVNFLKHNEFYGEREGRVYFLSERGLQLKEQGSLQKYLEWEMQREAQLMADLHTIESKGYLEQHQTYKEEPKPRKTDRNVHMVYYILILLAIFLIWLFGRRYMH